MGSPNQALPGDWTPSDPAAEWTQYFPANYKFGDAAQTWAADPAVEGPPPVQKKDRKHNQRIEDLLRFLVSLKLDHDWPWWLGKVEEFQLGLPNMEARGWWMQLAERIKQEAGDEDLSQLLKELDDA